MINVITCGHAIRQVRKTFKKHAVLATAIIAILAIGMAVNIVIFMIIDAALFRPIPAAEPDRLLSLYDYDIKQNKFGNISDPDYLDIAEYSGSFESLTAYAPGTLKLKIMKIRNSYQTPYVKQSAVVSIDFQTNVNKYSSEKKDKFLSALMREADNLRGIKSICFANNFPLSGGGWANMYIDVDNEKRFEHLTSLHVSNGCFETFGTSLLYGRTFDERDDFPNSDAVIITKSLAKKYWKTSNPLNQRIMLEGAYIECKEFTIIGIVNDVKEKAFNDTSSSGYIFFPFSQNSSKGIDILGRGGLSAPLILDKLQRMVYDLDDNLIITEKSTMQQYADRQTYMVKALIAVFVIFGLSGMLLTCIGIYGLVSHSVAQRRHEVGIRMAVGARRTDIIMMFLKEGLKVVIPGLLLGNAAAALIIHIASMSSAMGFVSLFIPRISLWEPFIFVGASAIIGVGTMLACYIPTLKITFENPMTAIKQL